MKTTKQNANNIMWVEYWIRKAHPSFEEYVLSAERYDDSRWICEIKLPVMGKTIKSISKTEVAAMINASNKAAKLIDECMKNHPEMVIRNRFKGKRWEIESDEDGRFLTISMNSDWRNRQDKQLKMIADGMLETIKKAVKKLAKINGSSEDLFIQVLDKSLFDKNMSIDDIVSKIDSRLEKEYQTTQLPVCYGIDGNSIIVIGYMVPTAKEGDEN